MGKIDIVILIIMFLLILIGFNKGFVKQVLSVANWLIALIGAFAFVKPFTQLMLKTTVSTSVNSTVSNWIASKGESFNIPYDPANSNEQLANAISEVLKLPKFIANIISGGVNIPSPDAATTLAEVLAPSIGNVIVTVISFFILFVGLFILLKIIIHLINIVFQTGILGFINKLLGAALGLLKGVIIVSLAMLLISVISGVIPSLNEFLISDLNLGTEGFSIGKYFYENNPLIRLIEGSFTFDNILG